MAPAASDARGTTIVHSSWAIARRYSKVMALSIDSSTLVHHVANVHLHDQRLGGLSFTWWAARGRSLTDENECGSPSAWLVDSKRAALSNVSENGSERSGGGGGEGKGSHAEGGGSKGDGGGGGDGNAGGDEGEGGGGDGGGSEGNSASCTSRREEEVQSSSWSFAQCMATLLLHPSTVGSSIHP